MREYSIRGNSLYSGTHIIYENEVEFRSGTIKNAANLHRWAVDSFKYYQVGDYVKAEDGYIVQILSIKKMKSKKKRTGQTVFIRFPMGTFAVYEKANGTVHYPRFYAQFTSGDKSSAGGRARSNFSGSRDESIRRFAKLISCGYEHRTAFRLAFVYKKIITNSQIDKKITNLFSDDVFLEEMNLLLKPYNEKFDKKFSDERLIENLESLLDNSVKGSGTHRENLKLILSLKGYLSN